MSIIVPYILMLTSVAVDYTRVVVLTERARVATDHAVASATRVSTIQMELPPNSGNSVNVISRQLVCDRVSELLAEITKNNPPGLALTPLSYAAYSRLDDPRNTANSNTWTPPPDPAGVLDPWEYDKQQGNLYSPPGKKLLGTNNSPSGTWTNLNDWPADNRWDHGTGCGDVTPYLYESTDSRVGLTVKYDLNNTLLLAGILAYFGHDQLEYSGHITSISRRCTTGDAGSSELTHDGIHRCGYLAV